LEKKEAILMKEAEKKEAEFKAQEANEKKKKLDMIN
jgi:hypothetical protein